MVDTRSLQPGTLIVNSGGDGAVDEGQTFARSGSFVDDGVSSVYTATVDYGGGEGEQPLALAAPGHSFTFSQPYAVAGTYVVKVVVQGDGGTLGGSRFTVTARNVAPRIAHQSSGTARRGIAFRRRIVFTDPGADSWRAVLAWGDGSGRSRRPIGTAHGFVIRHTFRHAGLFTVSVRVFDRHGGVGLRRFRVQVRR